jgi:hypothetical protein
MVAIWYYILSPCGRGSGEGADSEYRTLIVQSSIVSKKGGLYGKAQ